MSSTECDFHDCYDRPTYIHYTLAGSGFYCEKHHCPECDLW